MSNKSFILDQLNLERKCNIEGIAQYKTVPINVDVIANSLVTVNINYNKQCFLKPNKLVKYYSFKLCLK